MVLITVGYLERLRGLSSVSPQNMPVSIDLRCRL